MLLVILELDWQKELLVPDDSKNRNSPSGVSSTFHR